jgi:predicted lipid-binding transport protein (Tim44 family)
MPIATDATTFPQHLVLWLHIALAIFTVGPITLAIMSTPRYIRQHNTQVVRYLARITFVFTIVSVGVLVAGIAIGQMLKVASKPWLIVSATLFLVTIVLLLLVVRDQRRAIRSLNEAAEHAASQLVAQPDPAASPAGQPPAAEPASQADRDQPAQPGPAAPAPAAAAAAAAAGPAHHVATVERGRIAMLGGVVSLIYLVILVLMVWNG